jgi:hypothetical protein
MESRGSKTLLPSQPRRRPSWPVWALMKSFRLLALTALWGGVGMGAGLFGGILVLMTVGVLHHRMPEMNLAYRRVAIPAAIVAGICAFLWNLVRTVQAALRRGNEL